MSSEVCENLKNFLTEFTEVPEEISHGAHWVMHGLICFLNKNNYNPCHKGPFLVNIS